MPIISVRANENKEKWKKQRQKETKGWHKLSESVRAKGFCCAFKLGFVQLICKTSLIFMSNLELTLSIVLKERKL